MFAKKRLRHSAKRVCNLLHSRSHLEQIMAWYILLSRRRMSVFSETRGQYSGPGLVQQFCREKETVGSTSSYSEHKENPETSNRERHHPSSKDQRSYIIVEAKLKLSGHS